MCVVAAILLLEKKREESFPFITFKIDFELVFLLKSAVVNSTTYKSVYGLSVTSKISV